MVNVDLDFFYQTGVGNTPTTVALDGTKAAQAAGSFKMAANTTSFTFELQSGDEGTAAGQVAVEIAETDQGLGLRTAFGRVTSDDELFTIVGGTLPSLFGDSRAIPKSIISNTLPAGCYNYTSPTPQFGMMMCLGDWSSAVAIENPITSDMSLPSSSDVALSRVPTLIMNARYEDPTSFESFDGIQFSGIVRTFGFEDDAGQEHFATGFGGAAYARYITNRRTLSNIRMGVMGGRGIGSYLFGLSGSATAAGPINGIFRPFDNFGSYIGYQHHFSNNLYSNVAYGYALSDGFPDAPATAQRKFQNGWFNIYRRWSDTLALGFEYQYLGRRITDLSEGENHLFVMSIQWSPKASSSKCALERGLVSSMAAQSPYAPNAYESQSCDPPSRYKSL